MKAVLSIIGAVLALALLSHTVEASHYGYGYSNYNYAPGTWAMGQNAYNHWPAQWTGGYNQNSLGWHGYYTNEYYPRYSYGRGAYYHYSPTTHSRFIPAWKYPQYYGG